MYDKEIVSDVLLSIQAAAERILKKMKGIDSPSNFNASERNRDRLDVICMQLTAIGEGLKQVDRITEGGLLSRYEQVDWKGLKGIRDVITHQYFSVSPEAVHDTCRKDVPVLLETIKNIIKNIS